MKHIGYKIAALLMAMVMLTASCLIACGGGEEPKELADVFTRVETGTDEEGEYLLFGAYPQGKAEEPLSATLTALAGALPTSTDAGNWTVVKPLVSTDESIPYLWYLDMTHDGARYRGVYFTKYRIIEGGGFENVTLDMGYVKENVYWFRYEPIKWRVIDKKAGVATLMSEVVLDAHAYRQDYYSNVYENSDVRAFLNQTFYQAAFTEEEKAYLYLSDVDNSAESAGGLSTYCPSENTQDYVFLPSYADVTALYPEEAVRTKAGCDYAFSMGLTRLDGAAPWWLRSSYQHQGDGVRFFYSASAVNETGFINTNQTVIYQYVGVCPMIRVNLYEMIAGEA